MTKFKNGHPSWFKKQSVDVEVSCPCGTTFTTTSIRVEGGRGKFCSKSCFYKYRTTHTGPAHHKWKDDASLLDYTTIHQWVYRTRGQPDGCEECGTQEAQRFEWANISGEYRRDESDWRRLCSVCHHRFDDIAARGWGTRKAMPVCASA